MPPRHRDGTFYSTYGWHPRSVAAAIAVLRDLKANRRRLLLPSLVIDRRTAARGIDILARSI